MGNPRTLGIMNATQDERKRRKLEDAGTNKSRDASVSKVLVLQAQGPKLNHVCVCVCVYVRARVCTHALVLMGEWMDSRCMNELMNG